MYTVYLQSIKYMYRVILLAIGAICLGSCSHSHQMGMEDNPQEILNRKLNDRDAVLNPSQSITLLNHCAQLGEQNAASAAKKVVTMVLGNTGAGKSTSLNALMGCQMKTEIDECDEEIIIVDPESPRPEVMPIGHGRRSQTFLPKIAQDPQHPNSAYCDCPGFADNRGAEINIANSLAIKHVLHRSHGVNAVFLAEYSDFFGSRGSNIQAMENMCQQMFGGVDNIGRYQNAVLLGITKAPIYNRRGQPFSVNSIRLKLTQANSPIAHILANRVFLFDPLDRGHANPEFWSLERCRNEITQLDSIPQQQATNLFRMALTDSDRTHLLETIHQIQPRITNAILQGDVTALAQQWQLLQRLHVIEHPEITQLVEGQVVPAINVALRQLGDIETWTNAYDFDQAEAHIARLTQLMQQLPGAALDVNLDALRQRLARCREQHAEQRRRGQEWVRLIVENIATRQMIFGERWMEQRGRKMRESMRQWDRKDRKRGE